MSYFFFFWCWHKICDTPVIGGNGLFWLTFLAPGHLAPRENGMVKGNGARRQLLNPWHPESRERMEALGGRDTLPGYTPSDPPPASLALQSKSAIVPPWSSHLPKAPVLNTWYFRRNILELGHNTSELKKGMWYWGKEAPKKLFAQSHFIQAILSPRRKTETQERVKEISGMNSIAKIISLPCQWLENRECVLLTFTQNLEFSTCFSVLSFLLTPSFLYWLF